MELPLAQPGPGVTYDEETGLAVSQLAVGLVFLTMFLDSLAATISTPALPYYAREFGADNAQIGYLFASWSLASSICPPVLGRWSDRIGRQKILLLSLLGAGLANVGQACAWSYSCLLACRAFSGVWAAVGSTANVYLADVCTPAKLPSYLSWLASVGPIAMTFGPALGGGLALFGLNVPVLVDGLLSFAGAMLVAAYLPESPVWKAEVAKRQATGAEGGTVGGAAPRHEPVEATPMPRVVNVVGVACLFAGVTFGVRVSMLVVSLTAKFGFQTIQVGYFMATVGVANIITGIWISPLVQRRVGTVPSVVGGLLAESLCVMVSFCFVQPMWPSLAIMVLGCCGGMIRMSAANALTARFADATNRGAVFARCQMFTNLGRLVGPIVSGNLAVYDPVRLPWLVSGSSGVVSALIYGLLVRAPREPEPKAASPAGRVRGFSALQEQAFELEDEVGTPEDYERVGRHVVELLRRGHYRWVSRQDSILEMLDALLPELSRRGPEQLQHLDALIENARALQAEQFRRPM